MNFQHRVFLAPLALVGLLVACGGDDEDPPSTSAPVSSEAPTQTRNDYIAAIKATINVSPTPVVFGEVPIGTTKEITVYLKTDRIGNAEYLQFKDRTPSGGPVAVTFSKVLDKTYGDCEGTTFGKDHFSCKLIFTLNLRAAGASSSGVGKIKLEAELWKNPVQLGSFFIEVPYEWGALAQTTVAETVPINTTETTIAKVNTTKTTTVPINTTNPLTNTTSVPINTTSVPINTTNPLPNTSTVVSSTAVPTTAPSAPPAIAVSPSEYNFGSVPYRTAPHDFVVTNTGGGTLRFTSFRFALGDQFFYTIRNTCEGAELAAGQSCSVSIEVSSGGPDISPPPGDHADTMNIVSNGGNASISLRFTTPG